MALPDRPDWGLCNWTSGFRAFSERTRDGDSGPACLVLPRGPAAEPLCTSRGQFIRVCRWCRATPNTAYMVTAMATTIAILSQKGGTGKTTMTRSLADIFERVGLSTLA